MADFVDDLLSDAVFEDIFSGLIRKATIRGGAQSVRRDDAAAAAEIGKSKDVVPTVIKEVLRRDSDVFRAIADAFC